MSLHVSGVMCAVLLSLGILGIQSYSQMMIGMSNHLLSIAFRFYYIPFSEGDWIPRVLYCTSPFGD